MTPSVGSGRQAPIVSTTSGFLSGHRCRGAWAFLGVPYAGPPFGPRRFRPPSKPEPWEGVRLANRPGPICAQVDVGETMRTLFGPSGQQGDDCLNLNVWTPDPSGRGLPVMVWIHGGAFLSGSGSEPFYNGSFAADGVVTVTCNYRLGAEGFMHVGEEDGSGAFGLLDQIAVLQWVAENIEAFGGDPGRVTIAGLSAGAMSVVDLLASPAAKGLYRRAIAQSGAAQHRIDVPTARLVAERCAAIAGLSSSSSEAFAALTPEELIKAQVRATRDLQASGELSGPVAFEPMVGAAALPEQPLAAIRDGSARHADLIVGTTRDEMSLFYGLPGSAAPGSDTGGSLSAATLTDITFRIPCIQLADAQAKHAKVFVYRFSWPTPAFGGSLGACHGLDLGFVWKSLDEPHIRTLTGPQPPAELSNSMHSSWVRFISGSDPGPVDGVDWPEHDPRSRPTLEFDVLPKLLGDSDKSTGVH